MLADSHSNAGGRGRVERIRALFIEAEERRAIMKVILLLQVYIILMKCCTTNIAN